MLAAALLAGRAEAQSSYGSGAATPSDTPFVHPGMMQNGNDLAYMKDRVLKGMQPWTRAFGNLRKAASLSFRPVAFTHITQGPYGADDSGGGSLLESADQVYADALLWYITADSSYANKAIEILNAWSYTLWDFDGNNAKLLAGLSGYYFLNAAEILRYSHSGWQAKDIAQFEKLMLTVYYPLIKDFFSEANGNWDASMINTMLCIGIFTGNRPIFNRAVERFYRGPGNSGITRYIYPGGQIQETTRDWGHVQLGIGELAKAAQVAWTQGVDFYSVAGDRLAQGFEYAAKYMLGGQVSAFGDISIVGRGVYKDRDIYEGIYNHYHDMEGLDMPYTRQVITEHTRPNSSLGVLTGIKAPAGNSTMAKKPFSSKALSRAGALDGPTARVPADAILVQPGASIQAAVNALGGRKGWVVLAAGVHELDSPLKINSNVTLSGMGLSSIVILKRQVRGFTIVSGDPKLHGVVLRDFVVEGAIDTVRHADPNDERRKRLYMNAESRGGVDFSADSSGGIRDIRLIHLSVPDCTKSGLSLSGARDVTIDSCNLYDNGGSVVPGAGLHHDLKLDHVSECRITGSRFDDSPWGSGIFINYGKDVVICGVEAARNRLSGIQCSQCTGVRITGSLLEGNDGGGVHLYCVPAKAGEAYLLNNILRNNGAQGILINNVRAHTQDNITADNGTH